MISSVRWCRVWITIFLKLLKTRYTFTYKILPNPPFFSVFKNSSDTSDNSHDVLTSWNRATDAALSTASRWSRQTLPGNLNPLANSTVAITPYRQIVTAKLEGIIIRRLKEVSSTFPTAIDKQIPTLFYKWFYNIGFTIMPSHWYTNTVKNNGNLYAIVGYHGNNTTY